MDKQCVFCSIIDGSVASKAIYEDDVVKVILDIYPANPAHMLVLTRNHHAIFNQLSKEEAEHLGMIARRLSELIFKVLKPEGINFFIANGAVAGQKAPHFILHIIPRFQGDGLNFELAEKEADEKEVSAFYEKLKATLKNYFPKVDFVEKSQETEKEEVDLDDIAEMFS